jgi:hypothetical protein
MNKRQKILLRDFVAVVVITALAVVAMINFRDWVNRSEARRAMEQLGIIVLRYRQNYGALPPEAYVAKTLQDMKGQIRLVGLKYRALWVDSGSTPDEILAYTEKNYRSFLVEEGYVVLRLDGRVEWMGKEEFKSLLAQQQSPAEVRMMRQ